MLVLNIHKLFKENYIFPKKSIRTKTGIKKITFNIKLRNVKILSFCTSRVEVERAVAVYIIVDWSLLSFYCHKISNFLPSPEFHFGLHILQLPLLLVKY
jgi:hypothetical protein